MSDTTRSDALLLLAAASASCASAAARAADAGTGKMMGPGTAPARFSTDFIPKLPMDVYAKIRCSLRDEAAPFWYRGHVMIALQDTSRDPASASRVSATRVSRRRRTTAG